MRKKTEMERQSHDRLSLIDLHFASEIYEAHIIPFIQRLCNNHNHIYLATNGATWHYGPQNKKSQKERGYVQLPQPSNSPNLNPIENI